MTLDEFKQNLYHFCEMEISKNIGSSSIYPDKLGYCEAMMVVQKQIKNMRQTRENTSRIDEIENYDRWHHFDIIAQCDPIYELED